jgi:hypothetical protein
MTNNDIQTLYRILKIEIHEDHYKRRVQSGVPEGDNVV